MFEEKGETVKYCLREGDGGKDGPEGSTGHAEPT